MNKEEPPGERVGKKQRPFGDMLILVLLKHFFLALQ